MRFYVTCKYHPQERIYVTFQQEPVTRARVPRVFTLKCPSMPNLATSYFPNDVYAEVGPPIGGALVGALLFLVDPLLGLAGMIIGATIHGQSEQDRVRNFNNSNP